jgi:hypothetical protein
VPTLSRYPTSFAFSSTLLLFLTEAAASRWCVNFSYDSDLERQEAKALPPSLPPSLPPPLPPLSVWDVVRAEKNGRFRNVLYAGRGASWW